ncbi:hypothetical protein E4V99_13945 [Microbacterium sp. dk485]|uniref:hypothetical protein n=1 Tax=Microbacterium sp. dk485 TaxID=2560021 RepID=UPI0010745AE1|nr:hypothetical protein [Microbacterium sp. dk485]TFV82031.1 hypothetical protein E4V99_13945 [Microbacterium sp. dk485]
MPDLDIERIATSNVLFEMADRFATESTLWAERDAVRNLTRTARHLSQLARQTLTGGDPDIATAYADAADLLIRNIEGARRFLHCLDTPPIVRRPQ